MRGKVLRLHDDPVPIRITPAYAGKRVIMLIVLAVGGDHPRICGEKSIMEIAPNLPAGSPPHMRGKVNHDLLSFC